MAPGFESTGYPSAFYSPVPIHTAGPRVGPLPHISYMGNCATVRGTVFKQFSLG